MPVTLNPTPEVLIWEIVMLTFPVFLTPIACGLLLPTMTLLKSQLAGFAVSCANGAAAPVPVKGKLFGEPKAVLTSETLPLKEPVIKGAKITVNEVLDFAANMNGRVNPVTLYAAPATFACEMVTLVRLLLIIDTDFAEVVFTATLPKASEVGLRESRRVRDHGLIARGALAMLVITKSTEEVSAA